jgi:lipopolysaccharide export system permease protein
MATFFVVLFILLMQFLWKYIDDLVGKGLEWYVITELMFYATATLVPLALPLAILVSSIMTMGNLAENYEIVAAKSAGISLQKLLRPMMVVALLVSGLAFFFSNYMLPYTNLKMGSLLYDVRQQKPALYIREGIFYNGIDGYSIKIGEKENDNQTLRNIMIYDHTSMRGNTKVVLAESGRMVMSDDEKYLIVTLFNGHSFEEQDKERRNGSQTYPFLKTRFDSYEFRFDLSTFKLSRTNEELFKDNYQMLNLDQLSTALDSFDQQLVKRQDEIVQTTRTYYAAFRDDIFKFPAHQNVSGDSTSKLIPDAVVYENALGMARNVRAYLQSAADEIDSRKELMARFTIEWHRKLTLSIACLILFLIGAPLGAIIRKGGIGLPVVVSVIFFLIFHVTSIMGEKFAREGVIETWAGMWIAPAVLFPVGLILLYKATHDSALFDPEVYVRLITGPFKRKKK